MKVHLLRWDGNDWLAAESGSGKFKPNLVFYFGKRQLLENEDFYAKLNKKYPDAHIVGCSTAGEILGEEVYDESIVAAAVKFEKASIKVVLESLNDAEDSAKVGAKIGDQLNSEDLKGVILISDGQVVNGSELVKGISEVLPEKVITGGLAGDGADFSSTLVGMDGPPKSNNIVGIGLSGEDVRIGHGSFGGWDSFGPQRQVTKSRKNVLYELDGIPALQLYKQYLAEEAENLPGSALLFPLMLKDNVRDEDGTVRTVLSVDEESQSMTFAGNMPEGSIAQLMMANFERLIEGAATAANSNSIKEVAEMPGDKLALLISCVGRKMVLGQRTEEEVEIVKDILNHGTKQIGFYSYGEISPHLDIGKACELHNQTMTITLISEQGDA